MADLFEEVEEQLRYDRYKSLAMRALPWVAAALAAALVVALAVWGWQAYTAGASAKASETYAKALDELQAGKSPEAFRLFGEVAGSSSKPYKALALMQQGGIRASEGKTPEAVKLFDEAADVASNPLVKDSARLKSALALLDTASYKDLEARLNPLLEDDRPFRVQAREALAYAKLLAGNTAGAREDFVVLSLQSEGGESIRQRARAAMALIDSGGAKALAATVKAAAALPPPPQPVPGAAPIQPQAPGPQ